MKKDIGLYIHMPFCKAKCYYCDFISYANKEKLIKEYVEALIKEMKHINLSKYSIQTVYIGGGTPSLIDNESIAKIMDNLRLFVAGNAEITIEINPGTANKEKLKKYKEIGINRLSIGLQSADNELLSEIGRIHKYEDFLNVYNEARNIGFRNINVDLMLGLPNQDLKKLEESVKEVITLSPEHISIYSLILEENTKLYDMVMNEELKLPDEAIERKMYWNVKKMLENEGYIHYEISNFAKKGYESQHNLDCWRQKEYVGFGVAAHSYTNAVRYSNIENLEEYIENYENDKLEDNFVFNEKQTHNMKVKEYMMLGLRKLKGVSIQEFKEKFVANPIYVFKNELEKLVNEDLLEIDGDYIRLTKKGLDLANLVWEEFV